MALMAKFLLIFFLAHSINCQDCLKKNLTKLIDEGDCEKAFEGLTNITLIIDSSNELTRLDILECNVAMEADTDLQVDDYVIRILGHFISNPTCQANLNLTEIIYLLKGITSHMTFSKTDTLEIYLSEIVQFAGSTIIQQMEDNSRTPNAGIADMKVLLSSMKPVISEVYSYTLPSNTQRAKSLDEIYERSNCTQFASSITDEKKESILRAKNIISDMVLELLESFVMTCQRLSGSNIQIDVPPFYVSSRSMKLRDLPGFYQCPYGSIDVSSVSSVNTSLVTVQDNVIVMFMGFDENVFGGNTTSTGMINSAIRLEVFSPDGDKLTNLVQAEGKVEIKTREDKIKAATVCPFSSYKCDNTTSYSNSEGVINKESHSIFIMSPESNNIRLNLDSNETYTMFLLENTKPSETLYDLQVEIDQLGTIWVDEGRDDEEEGIENTSSWNFGMTINDQDRLILYMGAGDNTYGYNTSKKLHVVVKQNETADEGNACSFIVPDATNIDLTTLKRHDENYEYVKSKVSLDSTKEKTKFKSNFLGTFTVDLFYPPNTIDFSSVFEDFASKVADNWLVLGTIVVMLAISFSLGIWMRWLDKKDAFMWEFRPLVDNALLNTHSYKISIQTGTKGDTLTNQRVQMNIVGENGFSGPRVLDDGQRKNFLKGSINNFLMSTFDDLGELHKIEFWLEDIDQSACSHTPGNEDIEDFNDTINKFKIDDSGDLNTNNSNNVNSTKSQEIKKLQIIKVSVADVKKSERYFFDCNMTIDNSGKYQDNRSVPLAMENSVKNFWFLFNNHAKRGIFDDHLWLSTFKRPNVSHFTRLQRLGCCVSALFLAMVASCMWYKTEENSPNVGVEIGPFRLTWHAVYTGTLSTLMVLPVNMGLVFVFQKVKAKESDLSIESSRGKKKFALPRWFLIPAWIVLILSVLVSGFFTFLYSIEWGKATSTEWLVSQIVGTLENILLFQSVKVFLLAIFFALVLRLPSDPVDSNNVTVPVWRPPDDPDKVKRESKLDRKMFTNIRNIILSLAYIILLLFIAISAMDSRGFFQNKHIKNALLGRPEDPYTIETFKDMYAWLRSEVIPYHSRQKTSYMVDDDYYHLAPLRLKQIRYPEDACSQPSIMDQIIKQKCHGILRILREDQFSYGLSWSNLTTLENMTTQNSYFMYRSAEAIQGIPTTGDFGKYTGGGFVADLSMDYNTSLSIIDELVKLNWVTGRTKAVIIESTLFNGNINLFTIVKFICEKTELGRVFVYPRIQSFRLYTYVGATGILALICHVLWLFLLLYFIIQEFITLKKEGCKYFSDLWNVTHAVHLNLALVSVGLYLARIPYIIDAVERVHNEHGTFVSFDALALWDEIFTVVLAFVLFLGLIELLKYFQFIQHLANFIATIRFSVSSIRAYSIVFGVAFWAYTFLGYLWLGSTVESFSWIVTAAETLMSAMLGKLSKDLTSFENNSMGMIYFMSYVVVIGFILVDMFISIMTDTYEYIKDHPEMSPYDEELADHMSMRFKGLFRSLFGGKEETEVKKNEAKTDLVCQDSQFVKRFHQLYHLNLKQHRKTDGDIITDKNKLQEAPMKIQDIE